MRRKTTSRLGHRPRQATAPHPPIPARRSRVGRNQTRRRFGGRHPLWGIGVVSVIDITITPLDWSERTAISRPDPGPRTKTSTCRKPCSWARRAAASAVICAANGVLLREPLKPFAPALDQAITLPVGSVSVTMVLLNVAWIYARPRGMFLRSLRRTRPFACPVVPRRSAILRHRLQRFSNSRAFA